MSRVMFRRGGSAMFSSGYGLGGGGSAMLWAG